MKKIFLFAFILAILSCSKENTSKKYDELSLIDGEQAVWYFSEKDILYELDIRLDFSQKTNSFLYVVHWKNLDDSVDSKDVSESFKGKIVSYDPPKLKLSYEKSDTQHFIYATLNPDKTEMILEEEFFGYEKPILKKEKSSHHTLD